MTNDVKPRIQLKISDINPYVRRASKHIIEAGFSTGKRVNRHYQLHYVCKGVGKFSFEGVKYRVQEGDFLIWEPAIIHEISSNKHNPLEVIGIQFDMTWNNTSLSYPCVHYSPGTFQWHLVHELIDIEDVDLAPFIVAIYHKKQLKNLFQEIVKIYNSKSQYSLQLISGLVKTVILMSFEDKKQDNEFKSKETTAVQEIVDYLSNNYNLNHTNEGLGKRFNYHPNYLSHLVLEYTGKTVQQYLIDLRISKAMDLLQNTQKPIGEIGDEIGGYSIHYFSRLFKKKVGFTPTQFRS